MRMGDGSGWRRALGATVLAVCVALGPGPVHAGGCTSTTYTDPPREVLDCAGGTRITAEPGAAYRLIDRNRDGRPDAAELTAKALLIEYARRPRGGFQVLTPHAVAAVRGTTWAVDVSGTGTAVFVEAGRVAVSRAGGGAAAVLKAGDGVDVAPGERGPLAVKAWGAPRRERLMARLGR